MIDRNRKRGLQIDGNGLSEWHREWDEMMMRLRF